MTCAGSNQVLWRTNGITIYYIYWCSKCLNKMNGFRIVKTVNGVSEREREQWTSSQDLECSLFIVERAIVPWGGCYRVVRINHLNKAKLYKCQELSLSLSLPTDRAQSTYDFRLLPFLGLEGAVKREDIMGRRAREEYGSRCVPFYLSLSLQWLVQLLSLFR